MWAPAGSGRRSPGWPSGCTPTWTSRTSGPAGCCCAASPGPARVTAWSAAGPRSPSWSPCPTRWCARSWTRWRHARLLTVTDGHVEVAHEALFRSWPRLRDWLAEDATARDVQRRITVRGRRLGSARGATGRACGAGRGWPAPSTCWPPAPRSSPGVEAAFVEASAARARRRTGRGAGACPGRPSGRTPRLRRLLGGLGITLAVALVAGALAVRSGNEATAQRETATAQRLAATAISEDYLAQRMLTAVRRCGPRSPRRRSARCCPCSRPTLRSSTGSTPRTGCSAQTAAPGSDQAVAIANLEAVHVFDTVTGESRVAWSEPDANLIELRVSPDGRYAAFLHGSWSGTRPPSLVVLDLASPGRSCGPATDRGGPDRADRRDGTSPTPLGSWPWPPRRASDVVQRGRLSAQHRPSRWRPGRAAMGARWPAPATGRMLLFAGQRVPARSDRPGHGTGRALRRGRADRGCVSPDGRWLATQARRRTRPRRPARS